MSFLYKIWLTVYIGAAHIISLPNSSTTFADDQLDFRRFLESVFTEAPIDAAKWRNPPDSSYGVMEIADAEDSSVECGPSDIDDWDDEDEGFTVLTLRSKQPETLDDSDFWRDEVDYDEYGSGDDEPEELAEKEVIRANPSDDHPSTATHKEMPLRLAPT
jgi:hypothetical protein